jgi:hypothetical protein
MRLEDFEAKIEKLFRKQDKEIEKLSKELEKIGKIITTPDPEAVRSDEIKREMANLYFPTAYLARRLEKIYKKVENMENKKAIMDSITRLVYGYLFERMLSKEKAERTMKTLLSEEENEKPNYIG